MLNLFQHPTGQAAGQVYALKKNQFIIPVDFLNLSLADFPI